MSDPEAFATLTKAEAEVVSTAIEIALGSGLLLGALKSVDDDFRLIEVSVRLKLALKKAAEAAPDPGVVLAMAGGNSTARFGDGDPPDGG